MAAAAPASGGTTSGAWPATTSRFAAVCGALSQYVRAAEAERAAHARPRPLPLMPGADVDADGQAEEPAQMTIVYGGQVLVLDDVPADKAAGLLRLAAAAAARGATEAANGQAADLPVARKASLQRFMEKRKVRGAARAAPYSRTQGGDACPDDDLKLAL